MSYEIHSRNKSRAYIPKGRIQHHESHVSYFMWTIRLVRTYCLGLKSRQFSQSRLKHMYDFINFTIFKDLREKGHKQTFLYSDNLYTTLCCIKQGKWKTDICWKKEVARDYFLFSAGWPSGSLLQQLGPSTVLSPHSFVHFICRIKHFCVTRNELAS